MRTLRQRWAFERCFQHKGSLAGILSRLSQIAHNPSTLSMEKDALIVAYDVVSDVLKNWDEYPTQSWKIFQRRAR